MWASRSYPPFVRPIAGHFIASAIALLLLIGGVLVITLAWKELRTHDNPNPTMPFGIILCVASGVTMLGTIAHWIGISHEQRRRSGAYYAVTDRRAIVWIPEPKSDAIRVILLPKGQIEGVLRIEPPDGSGTLELSCPNSPVGIPWYPFGFQHIHDVRRVEHIVRENLITAKEGSARKAIRPGDNDYEPLF